MLALLSVMALTTGTLCGVGSQTLYEARESRCRSLQSLPKLLLAQQQKRRSDTERQIRRTKAALYRHGRRAGRALACWRRARRVALRLRLQRGGGFLWHGRCRCSHLGGRRKGWRLRYCCCGPRCKLWRLCNCHCWRYCGCLHNKRCLLNDILIRGCASEGC